MIATTVHLNHSGTNAFAKRLLLEVGPYSPAKEAEIDAELEKRYPKPKEVPPEMQKKLAELFKKRPAKKKRRRRRTSTAPAAGA
jgi:hypothetical protein